MSPSEAGAAAAAGTIPVPLSAMLFDMDGLLLDTEAVHRRTMAEAAAALDIDLPDELFLRLVGVHRGENHRTLRAHFGESFPLDRFYEDSDRLFEATIATHIPLRPGVEGLLDLLDTLSIPRAVVTSTAAPFATERLGRAGLLHRFDTVVTRSDVVHPKPEPDPYLLGCARLGVSPAETIGLEDSPNGVRAAAAAGLVTWLVPDLVPATPEVAALAHATLDSLEEATLLLAARFGGEALPPPTGPR